MTDHQHDHDHSHSHDHDHSHSHTHSHDHDGDTYFIDQLCMVALSGAFGAICLCLWFLQTGMLTLMLGPQFHTFVLISGFVLVALALARGAILWSQSRDPAFLHDHAHHHHHDHDDHGHEHAIQEKPAPQQGVQSLPIHPHSGGCGHEHAPGESCGHGHAPQEHNIGHAHVHYDHDEEDHDHGWAPWRYVVILVPIILFLLGLPNKPPTINAFQGKAAVSPMQEAEPYLLGIGIGADPAAQLVHFGVALRQSGQGQPVQYKQLESIASASDLRAEWKDKVVEVRGQYSPYQGSDQIFMLVRLKISCCANDAVQLHVPMISREPIKGIKIGDWVKVTGRVDFRDRNGSFTTVLLISKAGDVVKCDPDVNPYIQ